MKNILQLLAKTWHVRLKINKLLKFNNESDEHQIAAYYKKTLNQLDDQTIAANGIDQRLEEVRAHEKQYHDREKITDLLLSIENFLLIFWINIQFVA